MSVFSEKANGSWGNWCFRAVCSFIAALVLWQAGALLGQFNKRFDTIQLAQASLAENYDSLANNLHHEMSAMTSRLSAIETNVTNFSSSIKRIEDLYFLPYYKKDTQ